MWSQQWPNSLSVLGCSRRTVRKMKPASKRRDSQLMIKKTREVWVGSKLPLNNPSLLLCPLTFTISLCFTNWRPRTSWYFLSCCGSVVVRLSAEFEGLRFDSLLGLIPRSQQDRKPSFFGTQIHQLTALLILFPSQHDSSCWLNPRNDVWRNNLGGRTKKERSQASRNSFLCYSVQ